MKKCYEIVNDKVCKLPTTISEEEFNRGVIEIAREFGIEEYLAKLQRYKELTKDVRVGQY